MLKKVAVLTFAAVMAVAASPLAAQDASPLTVRMVKLGADGQMESADQVNPGDAVRYLLVFANPTDGPLRSVVFDDPIPQGFVYTLGTATADPDSVLIEFSVDGGQTFTTEPTVDVRDEAGQLVRQPAPAAAYTHIRWTVQGELAQGASVTASFDATLGSGSPNTY